MKKFTKLLMLPILAITCGIVLVACGGNNNPQTNTYTLTYTAGTGGTINGTVTQIVNKDELGTRVTAVANSGYVFVQWSDGATIASRVDRASADKTFVAQFKAAYSLRYNSSANGTITGLSSQIVEPGRNGAEVIAVPNDGYVFYQWSDGVTTASRIDTNIQANLTVTAQYNAIGDTTNFAGGEGTTTNPYRISTPRHLANISLHSSSAFVITNDIDMADIDFAPLNTFGGILNGDNFKISNLSIDTSSLAYPGAMEYAGLFRKIEKFSGSAAKVCNLIIEDATLDIVSNEGNRVGILAGEITGNVIIENVSISGVISNSIVSTTSSNTGGMVGRVLSNPSEVKVLNCSTDVEITATQTGDSGNGELVTGGLIGHISVSTSDVTISNSYAIGIINVVSVNSVTGGLVGCVATAYSGESSDMYLSGSYSTIEINNSATNTKLGGLVGEFTGVGDILISNSHWLDGIGDTIVNAIGGPVSNTGATKYTDITTMQGDSIIASLNTGLETPAWVSGGEGELPKLAWQV